MSESPSTSQLEKPRKPWRRRIIRILAAMMVIVLALRLLFAILLPVAINRVAGLYDLNASYERSELNLMSGDAGLWHLKFTPKTGGEPIAEVGYVRGNISLLALLRLRLDVWRAEADGVQLLVERNADGSIPLLEKFLKAVPATSSNQPATSKPNEPLNLSAPIRIDALRLQNVAATLRDHSVSPTLETRTRLNLRLSDLGSPTRPTSLDMSLWVDPGLDLIRVEGVGKNTAEVIEADLSFVMRGLTPEALRPYLQRLGLAPTETVVAARGGLKVRLKRNAAPARSVGGTLEFSDLWLRTPTDRVAEAKSMKVNIDAADLTSAHIGSVVVDGGHVTFSRSTNGNLAFAGIELAGAPAPSQTTSRPSLPTSQPAATPFVWSVRELKVINADALFADRAIGGEPTIAAQLSELVATNIVFDPAKPNASVNFTAAASVKDVIGSASMKGTAMPFAPSKRFEFEVSATDICPRAAEPYLNALGIESTLKQGSAAAKVSGDLSTIGGAVAANLNVRDAVYRDGEHEFANLKSAEIQGVRIDDATGAIHIKNIEIVGPSIAAGRDASGRAAVFGFAGPVQRGDAASVASVKPPATQPSLGTFSLDLPRIQIDQFTWKDIRVSYDDQSMPDVGSAGISDAGIELNNLIVDLNSSAAADKPGALRAFLKAPGIAENFVVDGESSSAAGVFTASLKLRGDGITARALVPYLKLLGIEPTLADGRLNADGRVQLSNQNDVTAVSLNASNVTWRDGDNELLGVDELNIERASLTNGELNIAAITTVSPRISAARDQDGALRAAGLKFTLPQAPQTTEDEVALTSLLPMPLPISIGNVEVNSAALSWDDVAAVEPVKVRGKANLSLANLKIADNAPPASLRASAAFGELISTAEVTGEVLVTPLALGAVLDVKAKGIHWKPLAGYFPPGVSSSLQSGQFLTKLEAGLNLNDAGGVGAKFIVEKLSLNDGERTLAKVPSFRVVAPRIDPAGGMIDVQEISSASVEMDATILADGAASVLGFELRPPPVDATKEVEAVVTLPAASGTTQPSVAAIVAESQKPLPLLRVEKIDLNVARLTVHNQMLAGAEPIVVRDLSLQNKNTLEWAGPNLEKQPPTVLSFQAGIEPLAQTVRAKMSLAPFAQPAPLKIDVSADEIRGDAVTKLIPRLADLLDGSGLTAGHFETRVDAQLQPERRGNIPNYLRGFTADVTVAGTSLRRRSGGDVLGAVETIRAEGVRVEPASGNVIVKAVEIANVAAMAVRDERGVDVLGILVKVPLGAKDQGTPTTAPTEPAPVDDVATASPATQPAAAVVKSQSGSELRIDKFTMSGLDLRIIDKTVDPPIVMPVNAMDVEVAGLSNKLATEPRTLRFDAVLSGGKLGTGATTQPSGANSTAEKDFFSQIAAGGRIALYPEPKGWVKASINGVELSAFRGVANALGLTLGGGVFDGTIDARLKSDGLIETRNRLVLTELKLSEPPGGPISRTFKLGPPLDVVLAAVQDVDGSITLPIDVPIQRGELQMERIVGSAVGAVSQVLATAVASAPVKVVSGVGGLLGGEKDQAAEPRVTMLDFAGGDVAIGSEQSETLRKLAAQLRKSRDVQLTLRHELSSADATMIAQRANLSVADLRALTAQYRAQRDQLLAKRSALAGVVRGKVATLSSRESNAALEELRQVDRQLAAIESSLDSLLDQLKPGADRQSDRRTKGASLELGRQRLTAVRAILLAGGGRDAADRVRVIAPQFSPIDANGGVEITLIEKKKK